MKLQTLAQVLTEMPPPQRPNSGTGNVTSYGLILDNPSSNRLDYDEVEAILVFTDKIKFQKHIAKLFANFTGDDDDAFLDYEEICADNRFDDFNKEVWFWDLFR
jgi:hypothetical protein